MTQAGGQPFDPVEHFIEIGGQLIQFVAGMIAGRAGGKVSGRDLARDRVEVVQPLGETAADKAAQKDAERQNQRRPRPDGVSDAAHIAGVFLDIAADKNLIAAQKAHHAPLGPALDGFIVFSGILVGKAELAVVVRPVLRQGAEIAGDALPVGPGQQIEVFGRANAALHHDAVQAIQAGTPVSAHHVFGLRLNGARILARHGARRRRIDIGEDDGDEDRKKTRGQQGDAEGRRA